MNWLTIVAIYFVVWWLCLFVVLPIGVKTQDEEETTILGTVGSAPARPMLVRKALAATVLSAVIVGALAWAWDYFDITLESVSRIFE
jgi:predicted secreted protein